MINRFTALQMIPPPLSLYTEIIQSGDPQRKDLKFEGAKCKEISDLIERGTFRLVLDEDPKPFPTLSPPAIFSV